jgi:acyl-CoA synthetase (AMP-forming)/AMP-acid ligase II
VFEAAVPISREALGSAFRKACLEAEICGDFNASVLLVDRLPRTSTGKIIRRLVRDWAGSTDGVSATPVDWSHL